MEIDKSWYKKPNAKDFPAYQAAGGVVARKADRNLFIALLNDPEIEGGAYQLPKGSVDNEENLVDAAKREISEEAGISDLTLITKLGTGQRLNFMKSKWIYEHFYLFSTHQKEFSQILMEKENYTVGWYEIDNLPDIFWPEQQKIILENKAKIKSYFA